MCHSLPMQYIQIQQISYISFQIEPPTPFSLFKSIDSPVIQPSFLKNHHYFPQSYQTNRIHFSSRNLLQHTQFLLKTRFFEQWIYSLLSCPKFTLGFLPFLSPPTLHPYAFDSLWPKSHSQMVLQ
jgi:hypothetical protein